MELPNKRLLLFLMPALCTKIINSSDSDTNEILLCTYIAFSMKALENFSHIEGFLLLAVATASFHLSRLLA